MLVNRATGNRIGEVDKFLERTQVNETGEVDVLVDKERLQLVNNSDEEGYSRNVGETA